ncbi:MAG: NAD(P)-dependent oxidoreductase [Desulfotomaculales bacterium]
MKILVVDDQTITIRALKEILCQELDRSRNEIASIRINRTPSLTSSASPVREFYGSAGEFAFFVSDADILAVHKAPVTEEVLRAARKLKLIACARNYPANIDLEAAARRGIPVVNAPGRASSATAELTVALMLSLARKITEADEMVKKKGSSAWDYVTRSALEGVEMKGKTAGIIGFGRAGKKVAEILKAFGMRILVYSESVSPEEIRSRGAKPATLEELLKNSDFITLHRQLTEKTAKILGAREFAIVKEGAYLINTARGGLVDEGALCHALKTGRLRGAALDVLTEEPPGAANPLLGLKNVLLTPHLGGKTKEAPLRSARLIADEIKRFLNGEKLQNLFCP